jgi:hypothetical protein
MEIYGWEPMAGYRNSILIQNYLQIMGKKMDSKVMSLIWELAIKLKMESYFLAG